MELLGEEAALEAFKAFLRSPEARPFVGSMPCPEELTGARFLGDPQQCADVVMSQGDPMMPPQPIHAWASEPSHVPPAIYSPRPFGSASHAATHASLPGAGGDRFWTLQTLTGSSLLCKQDFTDPVAAMAAYEAAARLGAPCILRDPEGMDVVGQSWLVVDHTSTRSKSPETRPRRCTTPVPFAGPPVMLIPQV